jgi:hypothetical protein
MRSRKIIRSFGPSITTGNIRVSGAGMRSGNQGLLAFAYEKAGLGNAPTPGTRPRSEVLESIADIVGRYASASSQNRLGVNDTVPLAVGNRQEELRVGRDSSTVLKEAYTRYQTYGLIRAVVLMMVDFSMTGFRLSVDESKDKSDADLKKYKQWTRLVGINSVLQSVFRDYWAVANCFLVPHYGKMKDLENLHLRKVPQNRLLKGEASDSEEPYFAQAAIWREFAKGVIPIAYEILPPSKMEISGPHFAPIYAVDIGQTSANALDKMKSADFKQLVGYQPVLAGKREQGSSMVVLPSGSVEHIGFDKQPYERIGIPFWWQSSFSVLRKEELMNADQIMARSGLQYLVTVTVGNDDFPANDEDIEAVAGLFLASGSAHTVFWNHTLNVQIHQPQLQLFGQEKYDPVNNAILEEMGIPVVLTGGPTPGNFSVARINVKPVIQRITAAQESITREFLQPQLEIVQEALGISSSAEIVWDPNPLDEIERLHNVLQAYYDRGLLTAKQATGFMKASGLTSESWEAFLNQMEDQNKLMDSGKLRGPQSPYNSPNVDPNSPNSRPSGDATPKSIPDRKQRSDPDDGGGAEPAAPKSQADLDPFTSALIESTEIDELGESEEDYMYDEAPAKLDRCVKRVRAELMTKWKKKNPGKTASEKTKKNITSRAWAICNSTVSASASEECCEKDEDERPVS